MEIRVIGLTQSHTGEPDKPNEDAWLTGLGSKVVVLADGITRPRTQDGRYPTEDARVASTTFVQTVMEELRGDDDITQSVVRKAIAKANQEIARENKKRNINQDTVDYMFLDYLGTVGCVLCFNVSASKAIFAYVGDVVAFHLPTNDSPQLITCDQLHACNDFCQLNFSAEQKLQRRRWQRGGVRNNAQNPFGFGAFTGEPEALEFLEVSEFPVEEGDRFILSSDALRVLATNGHEEETIDSYGSVLKVVKQIPFGGWPSGLISLIRRREAEKGARSDDATIVAVKVK